MIAFTVRDWSAWAPGLSTREDWIGWARDPRPPALAGAPELKFVPPMQRRRFSRLSKMALQVCFDACRQEDLSKISTVFASRHGELAACLSLLHDIARDQPLSPTQFSHSVHNTQSGLFSMTANNSRPSSSIAGMQDTFCSGLIEALGLFERQRSSPVMLIAADEPTPQVFEHFTSETPAAFAVALLVELGADSSAPVFSIEAADASSSSIRSARRISSGRTHAHGDDRVNPVGAGPADAVLPQALEFLAWMLGERPSLVLPRKRGSWKIARVRGR